MSDVVERARELLTRITPQPWVVAEEVDGVRAGRETVVRADDKRVVTVDQTRPHHDQDAEANVAFIAAAPRLVEGLIFQVEQWDKTAREANRTAIKATNRTEEAEDEAQRLRNELMGAYAGAGFVRQERDALAEELRRLKTARVPLDTDALMVVIDQLWGRFTAEQARSLRQDTPEIADTCTLVHKLLWHSET